MPEDYVLANGIQAEVCIGEGDIQEGFLKGRDLAEAPSCWLWCRYGGRALQPRQSMREKQSNEREGVKVPGDHGAGLAAPDC